MRIVSPQISLSEDSQLGGAVYDFEVLNGLSELGVTIDIPHLLPGNVESRRNWNIYPIPLRRFYGLGAALSNVAFILASMRLLTNNRPDLLRIAYPYFSGPALRLLSRWSGIPTVVAFHHLEEKESALEQRIHGWVARESEGIHVGSRFAAGQLADRYGVPVERSAVIPYGVDDRFRPDEEDGKNLRKTLQWGNRLVLLYVGSLIDRKNLFFLVEIFEAIRKQHPEALLLICGAGYPGDDYAERLRRRTEESPERDSIRMLGAVSEERKLALYRAVDVLVHPAKVEGFGLSVAEAMSCQRAVVVSRRGSLPEVVRDGETGFVADPDDATEFVEKLSTLLGSSELRRSIGERARQDVRQRFTWDRTARLTYLYYRNLTGNGEPARESDEQPDETTLT